MTLHIEPMNLYLAQQISNWAYEKEYSIYSFCEDKDAINELLNGDYYALSDQNNNLIGFFCTGFSARIPTIENYNYDDAGLDIGLGMKPELCGKGDGYTFMKFGIEFIIKRYGDVKLRLTVASFNKRAISVYKKIGFNIQTNVTHRYSSMKFFVMVKFPQENLNDSK